MSDLKVGRHGCEWEVGHHSCERPTVGPLVLVQSCLQAGPNPAG